MSVRRLGLVCRLELAHNLRRPLFWIMIGIILLTVWGLSTGKVHIRSGDDTVGGTKAWITSEFAIAQILPVLVFMYYSFFLAVAAGMNVIRDDELRVSELLHATPLRPGEYVWGKFLAIVVTFLAILSIHLSAAAIFNHLLPSAAATEVRGPFQAWNYIHPALLFALPAIVFLAGTSFWIGTWSRRPILVFVLPVALLLGCVFFLWNWAPSWLDPRVDQALMLIDPAGIRWLQQTWLRVDRGVDFYNTAPLVADTPFLLSRLVLVFLGLAAIAISQRQLAASLRGKKYKSLFGRRRPPEFAAPATMNAPLAALGMTTRAPGLLRGILEVARIELRELRSSPGLYLFAPLILLQIVGAETFAVGAFDTPLLLTPGTLAVNTLNIITLLLCLLLLFYTVESIQRERHTGMASIAYPAPVPTAAILFGKALANSLVGVVILVAAYVGCAILLLYQQTVPLQTWPFALVWGVLAVPTVLVWTSFVTLVAALTGNRYTTYAVALAALCLTGYMQFLGHMNWLGNWDLWNVLKWSDLSVFEMDRSALILNRLFVLALTVLFTAMAVRVFPRREFDAGRIMHRLRPPALLRTGLRLSPYGVAPLGLGLALYLAVHQGTGGAVQEKAEKDYWRKNLATWKDAPIPEITAVDLDCELDPERSWFHMQGDYVLRNHHDKPLAQIPVTGNPRWENLAWTLNGADCAPDNRAQLYVFTPPQPLAPGESVRIGFSYEGTDPGGISKNGGGASEFILPGGVVLTSLTPNWVPVLGFLEEIGVNDDNRYESRVYPEKWYEGTTEPFIGSGSAFTTHIRITGPPEYIYNSVGTCVEDEVAGGRRTVVWQSDHPVRLFNLVAGRWAVRRGQGTSVYFDPRHGYNIDEMIAALDAARRYYSEWFYPYPWRELKLSEFPALATYAQGFPTNITFSEGIGFLTKDEVLGNFAFVVTAHEAAHQWWGNMLTPGKGPGGNILSEGMAHFSTILLCEQVKGPHCRMEFCKRIEDRYGDTRQKDSERPMNRIDGTRPGDTTVTYDRGGWVFWMLLRHMGRDRALAGLHHFIKHYRLDRDHPVLEDFVGMMRPFAADPASFDAFVNQWIFDVVVPEYHVSETSLVADTSAGKEEWVATARIENVGTGRMPVEVAAVRGQRFTEDGKESPAYRQVRTQITLGSGEGRLVTLRCPFKPERIVVDPDVLVLQLKRKLAVARF
jgi:ABC-type transport system involved in multi-copper enzyme maturation permease subunit